jgi:penicillin-binding protein 1A
VDASGRPALRSLALFALRAWLTIGTAARRAGRAVMRAVQRAEETVVPTLIRLAIAIPRGLDRAERVVVPALTRFARAVPATLAHVEQALLVPVLVGIGTGVLRLFSRTETRVVPALGVAATATATSVARGEAQVAGVLRASGQGLLEGAQRVEAATLPALSPRVAPREPDQDDRPPPRKGRGRRRDYVPEAHQVRPVATPRQRLRTRLRSAAGNLAGLLATTGIVALVVSFAAGATLPNASGKVLGAVDAELILPPDPGLAPLPERSYLYAADGRELEVLDREANRRIVDLTEIPLLVQRAIIAAEDQRFYTHDGYDVGGIGRALVANFEAGDITQGGSTITQQLAKSRVGTDVTLDRKFEELAYAVALEQRFTKDELLAQYLNQVYFGENAYGIAAAAEEYFAKDVSQLTVEDGALLAAMIRSPNSANPRSNPEVALRRRNAILDAMVPIGFIAQESADYSKSLPLNVIPPPSRTRPYDFVADSILREFLTAPELAQFGATLEDRRYALYHNGLRIHSSLDPRLQDLAQAALANNQLTSADPEVNSGALVTVQPQTGRILAAASGLEYGVNQQAIPLQGRRQLGSAAKPYVYAEALRQGYPPGVQLNGSSPQFYDNVPGWREREGGVQNSGGANLGMMDMREALRRSVNTATVQLAMLMGIEDVVGLMSQMGIDMQAAADGQNNPAIALGGFSTGVTPLEAAGSYAVFANGGNYVRPHFIDRIEDRDGNVLYAAAHPVQQVLTPEVNATVVSMMQGVVTGGTGRAAQIPGWQVAGKTGTTTGQKDAWFVGYTANLSTAMWVGVPARATPTGYNGGDLPADVWQEYMAGALAGQPPVPFPDVAVSDRGPVPGQPVSVPDVTGQGSSSALEELTAARLIGQVRTVPNPAPAGTVIGQSVAPGTATMTGSTVTIDVSDGVVVPPPPSTVIPLPPPPG